MPTRATEDADLDTNVNPSKKSRLSNAEPDFTKVLLECGVSSLGSNDMAKSGSSLDQDVTPSSLRASIHGLLSEMHKGGVDVDNTLVLETMEQVITSSSFETDDGEVKNGLLWKMLLPMTTTCNSNDLQNGDEDLNSNTDEQITQLSQNLLDDKSQQKSFDASLIKILLRVDAIQSTLLTCLLAKLQEIATSQEEDSMGAINETLNTFTCNEEVPRLIISHIKWLELIADPILLVNATLECITVLCTALPDTDTVGRDSNHNSNGGMSGDNISRKILFDLIATLPDIVDDGSVTQDPELMDNILSTLRDVRVQDPTLLIPCLDAVSSLRFTTEEQVDIIINDALEALESVSESWLLPALCKFLVQNVARGDNTMCAKTIETFRRLRLGLDADGDMATDANEGDTRRGQIHDMTDSEALMLEALSQGFMYRTDLTNALINAIKSTAPSHHGAADLWLLMCCGSAAHNKAKVKQLVKSKTVSGGFHRGLVVDTVKGNGVALNHLFDISMLPLADTLVRASEKAAREFGGHLYEEMFLEFVDRVQRQEIVGQLVIHIASGSSYEESDVALRVFSSLVQNPIGLQSLRMFLPFLTSLLENVQNFQTPHLRRLFLLLFTIGRDTDDIMNGGSDDVQIIINKFLALQQIRVKQIGIIGAVAYASCLGENETPEKVKDAINMLELVHKSCAVNSCKRTIQHWELTEIHQAGSSAMSIFFGELCLSIQACSLSQHIKQWILDRFGSALENIYLGDFEGGVKDEADKALLDGTSGLKMAPKGELRYNIDEEEAVVYLKLLSLHVSEDPHRRDVVTQQLCPLLRLLTVAYEERYGGEGIDNIDALLGCPVLLPDSSSSSVDFTHLSEVQKHTTVATLFTAVSWFREVVNSFIHSAAFGNSNGSQPTQDQDSVRKKVVSKLKCLLDLEEEVLLCAKKCYTFNPPGSSPLPIPRDLANSSLAYSVIDETNESSDVDTDDIGRMSKEERQAFNTIKKAAKKKVAEKLKSKQKVLKLKAKYEDALKKRVQSALRPLSAYVCIALGFPELRLSNQHASSQDIMLSMGASELRHVKVGGDIINSLLQLLNDGLHSLFREGDKSTNVLEDLGENPYSMSSPKARKKPVRSEFQFLNLCIDSDVFVSIHERLVSSAEILGDEETEDDVRTETMKCTLLLLQCVTTLVSTEELHTPVGRPYFEAIMKQIAEGDRISSKSFKPMKSYPIFLKSGGSLFALLEEAITGSETDDLAFTMIGVDCVDSLVRRASSVELFIRENGGASAQSQVQGMKVQVSKLCLGLLRREWKDGTTLNKSNVGKLVVLYLEYSARTSPKTFDSDFDELKWGRLNAINVLINEALVKLPQTDGSKGPIPSFPSCCKATFGCYFSTILSVITKEMLGLFQGSISKTATTCSNSVKVTLSVQCRLISQMLQMFDLTKDNPSLAKSSYLLSQVKTGTKFIDIIVKRAFPFCAKHFNQHNEAVLQILKDTQKISSQMSFIIAHGKRVKDGNLTREGPKVRKVCEGFLHQTKTVLKKNGVLDAFWSGDFANRNIDGSKIPEKEEKDQSESGEDSSDTESETEE